MYSISGWCFVIPAEYYTIESSLRKFEENSFNRCPSVLHKSHIITLHSCYIKIMIVRLVGVYRNVPKFLDGRNIDVITYVFFHT